MRLPFSFRRYDWDNPEDLRALRKRATYIGTPEAAWPLRGSRARDKNPPRPPSRGRRINGDPPS